MSWWVTMKRRTWKKMSVKLSFSKVFFLTVVFIFSVSTMAYPEYLQFKPLYSYYNFSFGARALSMSNAFTAAADDLSAVFWNPAGMSEFKLPEAYVSYRRDKMEYRYDLEQIQGDTVSEQYGSNFESSLKNIDFLAVSVPAYFWGMKWNFALSYYKLIPYNMEGNWVENRQTTPVGSDSTTNEGMSIDFSGESGISVLGFSAAYHLADYFSLGVTLQQFLNSGTIGYSVVSDTLGAYDQTYTERIEGRNLILGFIFKPVWDVIIGITYRTKLANKFHSEYTLDQSGSASVRETSSDSGVVIPARLSFGVLVRPFKFMRITADYSIIYWSLGTVSNYYLQTADLEFPVRDNFTFSQEDYVNYRVGVEFKVPLERMRLFLRGGFFTEQPLFPDSGSNVIKIKGYSFGVGVDVSSRVAVDLAYMRQKADWAESGTLDTASAVSTHYENKIVSMGVTFRFGRPGS